MRVLIVEDETNVGSLAKRVLTDLGSVVDVAETMTQAFEFLADPARTYQVVVIDRVLPDGSGDEIATEVTARFPDVGIVLTSGRATTGRPTYDVWLAKPYGSSDLPRAVTLALAVRSKRRLDRDRAGPARAAVSARR